MMSELMYYIGMYCDDKVAHFLVGFLLTILLYNLGLKDLKKILLIVFCMAVLKEAWDMTYEIVPMEHLLDITATSLAPAIAIVCKDNRK